MNNIHILVFLGQLDMIGFFFFFSFFLRSESESVVIELIRQSSAVTAGSGGAVSIVSQVYMRHYLVTYY